MGEDIKPVHIYRPHHLRPLSRQAREEKSERFRKQLAELTDKERERTQTSKEKPKRESETEQTNGGADSENDEQSAVGRNLDMRT